MSDPPIKEIEVFNDICHMLTNRDHELVMTGSCYLLQQIGSYVIGGYER